MEEAPIERRTALTSAAILAATASILYVSDQVTKALVVAAIAFGDRIEVLGETIQLWHVRNTGAAFSLLPGATWLFIPVAIGAMAMVAYFFNRFRGRAWWVHVILGAILGGTLGNLTDRVRLGYVVDFVSVGIGDLRWPTFNIADSSLVLGIIALVIYLGFADGRRDEAAAR